MTNKKFTFAAIAAATIATAPIAAPVIGAITTMPVMAADNTNSTVAVSGTVTVKSDDTLVYDNANVQATQSSYGMAQQIFTVTGKKTLANGSTFYITNKGQYINATDVDATNVKAGAVTTANNTSAKTAVSGTVTTTHDDTLVFDNANVTASQSQYASKGTTYNVTTKDTLANGSVFYITDKNQYINAKDVDASNVKAATTNTDVPYAKEVLQKGVATIGLYGASVYDGPDGKKSSRVLAAGSSWKSRGYIALNDGSAWTDLGGNQWVNNIDTVGGFNHVFKINYVPGYGIAVWNSFLGNKKAIAGKKLMNGTNWKVFKLAKDSNGHEWLNVGGNQWIDSSYTTLVK